MKWFFLALVCAFAVLTFYPFSAVEAQDRPCSAECSDNHESATQACRRETDACFAACPDDELARDACTDKCIEYMCACKVHACEAYERCARDSTCRRKPYFSRALCGLCYRDR